MEGERGRAGSNYGGVARGSKLAGAKWIRKMVV
jgi:hypothetical protein